MTSTGIVLYHGIDSGPELAGYGRLAEDAGFDSLRVTERYFHEEASSMLGYLAATTERIRLGVGVVNPFTRCPTKEENHDILALVAQKIVGRPTVEGSFEGYLDLDFGLGRPDCP